MKRFIRFSIPAIILLFTLAVCLKLLLTPVQTGHDTLAWKFSPFQATTYWERGWPWTFVRANVQNPPAVGGVIGPANVYATESFGWALAGDVVLVLAALAIVSVWIYFRMRRERPWNFSIRTLLAGTLVVAACCGWWVHERFLWQREQAALAAFQSAGFKIDKTHNSAPVWLYRLLSWPVFLPERALVSQIDGQWEWPDHQLEIFSRADTIYLPTVPDSREESLKLTSLLPNFSSLREVSFPAKESRLDAEMLKPLAECSSVEELKLWYSNADDQCIAAIAELPRLKVLNLNDCPNVTDGAVESLLKLRSLETLWLAGTSISDAGVRRLLALPHLKQASMTEATSPATAELFRKQGVTVEQPVK